MKKFIAISLLAVACAENPVRPLYNGKSIANSQNSEGSGKKGSKPDSPDQESPLGENGGNGGSNGQDPSNDPMDKESEIKIPEVGSNESARYEAEDSFTAGTAKLASTQPGFTGKGYMEALAAQNDKLVFTVQSASLARTTLSVSYSAGAAKKASILINGYKVSSLSLAATAGAFKTAQSEIELREGLNTITFLNDESAGAAALIDAIEIKNAGVRANRGATVPFTVYEAEDGKSNGAVAGPSREMFMLPSAASGRKAVTLDATGKYVEWKTKEEANGLVIRYSMPDSQDGQGLKGTLSVYVDGKKAKSVELSSKYAWVYGGYGFTNKPEEGKAHRPFDDSRFLLDESVPAGATIRLQKDENDSAPSYTIDLIELETVPEPYARPKDSLSVVDFGAKADDGVDDTDAIRKAIAAAKAEKKVLWFPEGKFQTNQRFEVDHVTIRGAGPWHTAILGLNKKGGFHGTGDQFQLYDIAITGDVAVRDDGGSDAGIDGFLGKNSFVQNVWFEHTKVGIWSEDPTEGLYVVGCRIRNTFADGVNFYSGTKNSAVEYTHIRGTGDDGMAIWPERSGEYNRFRFNTIMLPDLANGIGIYGGANHVISDNLITDTQEASAGIAISTRFTAIEFSGTTLIERNTITRAGGWERNWNTSFGAIWVFADMKDITADIQVRDIDIIDANYQGILISNDRTVSNMKFERVNIKGAATIGFEARVKGSITATDVKIEGAKMGATKLPNSGFEIKGNSGF